MTAAAPPASPPSKSKPLPRLRPAVVEDYPQIEKLEASHGLLTLPAADWRAIWIENPIRQRLGERWPIGWVLEESNGRIVGSMANIPSLYTFKGRELIAATGRAWVVTSEYRGIALMLMDEYFNQDGADLFINTTVNSLAVDPFTAFGSTRVPLGDWETAAYWVTDYRGFARTALRIKHAPMPGAIAPFAGAALKVKDAFTVKLLPASSTSSEIGEASGFDSRFDAFWTELVRQNPSKLLGVRDTRTLTWHFAGPMRDRHLWIYTATRGGLIRAYGIFKRQDHPPSGLIRMRLVDYQTLETSEDLLPALVHVALQRCKAKGIFTLEHVCCDLPKMRAFDAAAPYRRKLPAWPYYYKAADAAIDAELREPQVWDPSTYDGDASL